METSELSPDSGWKLHIAANKTTADAIARNIIPYLVRNEIASKIVRHTDTLERWRSTKSDQRGKYITIYPSTYENARRIIKDVDNLLLNDKRRALREDETPLNEAQVGKSDLIFIRYGAYRDGANLMADSDNFDVVNDQKFFPFHPFMFDLQKKDKTDTLRRRVLGPTDTVPFPDFNLRWRFPGTFSYFTWQQLSQGLPWIFKFLDENQQFIEDKDLFLNYKQQLKKLFKMQ